MLLELKLVVFTTDLNIHGGSVEGQKVFAALLTSCRSSRR